MISNNSSNVADLSPPISEYPRCGYDIYGIEETNSRFKCIFCFLIMREPIQLTECGHRSCRECFEIRAAKTTDGNVICPIEDCNQITNKNQIMLDKAFKKELNDLRVVCSYRKDGGCDWTGFLKDYQKHLEENHINYNCPQCRQSFSAKAALDDHLRRCPEIFDECRLGILCTEDMIPKNEFLDHLRSQKHQETVIKFVTGEYHIPETSTHEQDDQLRKQLEENISKKSNDLSEEIRKLENVKTKLDETFQNVQQRFTSLSQEFNHSQLATNERLPIKQNIKSFHENLQKDLEKVQELYNDTQNIFTDGTLTWRIENISEKMADAQSERQTSIYSPIFYSSTTGYKMRVRLFLFGDGNARRTHISLFFLLMKGEYDSILKWPFHYKVTFCLLDQTGNNRHIIDSFYPDVKSSSFQRPREAANTASGIPKFFPLPMLLQDDNAYVRENTLYIKIIIALNETPKSMLPFMLTLNPALPSYVQENLINQEAAKQQSNTASSS